MPIIDYSREPKSDIAFVDMKSFYASVECVDRGLHPLKTSLCVMSHSDNTQGLILASSPVFKQVFGKKNVGRTYDLPFYVHNRRFNYRLAKSKGQRTDPAYVAFIESWARRTLFVPPRMSYYIEKNLQILQIFSRYTAEEDIVPYSIDEGFLDLTAVLNYFIPDPNINRRDKLERVASRIQKDIWQELGLASTIGLSNANPLLAKLALDNEAKKMPTMRANWSYKDVESKVWQIPCMTDFWGIGHRTQKRLNKMGIHSIYDLAHASPEALKEEFGIIGLQLFFHANGVDESKAREKYQPKGRGIGNSQILPRDYYDQGEIELVLSEMAQQVAIRLRRAKKKTTCVSIQIAYAHQAEKSPLSAQMKIDPSQETQSLIQAVLYLFRQHYQGDPVRQVGVRYSQLTDQAIHYYSLFDPEDQVDKREHLDQALDQIRHRFGHLAILPANSLKQGSRVIARSKLIGGHAAGGAGGLDGLS